jgi:outer membrane protein TolC
MVVHAQAQLAQAMDVWKSELRAVDQRMHHMREHIELIERTLLPQIRAHEALVRADYEAGRVSFEDVLTSAQALYTQRIELARHRAMLATLHAQWQLLIGQRDAEPLSPPKVSP